jgi:hypothetical protein
MIYNPAEPKKQHAKMKINENRGTLFFRNISNHLPDWTAWHIDGSTLHRLAVKIKNLTKCLHICLHQMQSQSAITISQLHISKKRTHTGVAMSIRPSGRPDVSTRKPLDGFWRNLIGDLWTSYHWRLLQSPTFYFVQSSNSTVADAWISEVGKTLDQLLKRDNHDNRS